MEYILSFLIVIILKIQTFTNVSVFSLGALYLFIFFLIKLIISFNKGFKIPLLLLFLYAIQYLFVPVIAFQFPEFMNHEMLIDEVNYFMIILPLFLSLTIGIFCINTDKSMKKLYSHARSWQLMTAEIITFSWCLVFIGFSAWLFIKPTGSNLDFLFYLIKNLRFVGFFILMKLLRLDKFFLAFVFSYGPSIYESFSTGMFHDLIIWSIFGFYVFFKVINASVYLVFLVFVIGSLALVTLQTIKGKYRENLSQGIEALDNVESSFIETRQNDNDAIWNSLERYNQGQIFSSVISHLDRNKDFQKGSHMSIVLRAAVLPRFLDPNKIRAGDQKIFMHYTDRVLSSNTAMAIGCFADFYIDYGIFGACVMSFFFGLIISLTLRTLASQIQFPILYFFIPLIFLFIIRPDCELQTSLGHLFKSCFLAYIVIKLFNKKLHFNYAR